jgi:hypothetical protein
MKLFLAAWLVIMVVGTLLVVLNPPADVVCFHSTACGYRGIEPRSPSHDP